MPHDGDCSFLTSRLVSKADVVVIICLPADSEAIRQSYPMVGSLLQTTDHSSVMMMCTRNGPWAP